MKRFKWKRLDFNRVKYLYKYKVPETGYIIAKDKREALKRLKRCDLKHFTLEEVATKLPVLPGTTAVKSWRP